MTREVKSGILNVDDIVDTNPFRYCGEYYDTVSGIIYLRARYYNSDLGRFTQQDGWAFANPETPLSLNLYTYCWNNPIRRIDAFGHEPVFALILLTTLVIAPLVMACGSVFDGVGEDHRIDTALMDTSGDLNTKHDDKLFWVDAGLSEKNAKADASVGILEGVHHVSDNFDVKWGVQRLLLRLG